MPFSDLVAQAQPAIFGGGVSGSLSAGRTYSLRITDVNDNDGDPIDLSAVTADCKIVAEDRTTEILELTFAGDLGEFTISADEADTAGLFTGNDYSRGRICYWYLTLTNGTDSIQIWMVDNSPITIRKGA